MRRHFLPRTVLAAGLAGLMAGTLAAAPWPAAASPAGQVSRTRLAAGVARVAGTGRAVASGAVGPAESPRPVLLINGDRLTVRSVPGGGQTVGLASSGAAPGGLLSLKLDQVAYELPADAIPYLGRGLDPSLFRLSVLQRAERAGRLPVRVSFAGRRPHLPGVTLTRYGPGSAAGYLTASSARVFGAALARQFRADHARDSYGADGMFSGGVSIALAGTALAPKAARPGFQMHTLTVAATNHAGRPDIGDFVVVFNADDWSKFSDPIAAENDFDNGTTRFSVPAGHYWAIADFFTISRIGFADHLDVLPQFSVTRNVTVHMAERASSSEITFATPRPAVTQMTSIELIRGGLHGTPFTFGWIEAGAALWISPTTSRPTVGTLQSFSSAQLVSPAKTAGVPYVYNLDYPGPDGIIPADQHFVVQPASLATVTEQYYQDVRTEGAFFDFGGSLSQLQGIVFAFGLPLTLPGRQVQYFSGGLFWQSAYNEFAPETAFSWGGQSDDTFLLRSAGQRQTVDWDRYPLHPQPPVSPGGASGRNFPLVPAAIRTGNTLNLDMTPFSDNWPGHLGSDFSGGQGATVTGTYQIDQNGVPIAHGSAVSGIPPVRLSPSPSRLSLALNAALTGSFPLSTGSQTVWTWRSSRRPHAVLPSAWFCRLAGIGVHFKLLRGCAAQPLMTLTYQVRDLSLNGSAPTGPQLICLQAGHIQPSGSAAITGASAQVSFNDGQSWRKVPVTTSGGGGFQIAFSAPGGVDVTLRVTATDADGGSIRETILRAYGVRL